MSLTWGESRRGASSKTPEIASPPPPFRWSSRNAVRCPPADQPEIMTGPAMPCSTLREMSAASTRRRSTRSAARLGVKAASAISPTTRRPAQRALCWNRAPLLRTVGTVALLVEKSVHGVLPAFILPLDHGLMAAPMGSKSPQAHSCFLSVGAGDNIGGLQHVRL